MSDCTIDQTGLPMMTIKEIGIIDKLIKEHQPKRCLEWGSGNSTIYFPNQHDCIESWLSIENNGHYKEYLDPKIKHNTEIFWTTDMELYVNYPILEYDFILIDGRSRMKCLEVACQQLKRNGIIILHDSGRTEYDLSGYKHKILSEGEIPYDGGFAHRGLALIKGKK